MSCNTCNNKTCSCPPQAPGERGNDGLNANQILSGAGAPAAALGNDNDFYLDTANGDYYKKTTGSWAVVINLKGADGNDGVDGPQILNSAAAPLPASGVDGDYHLDTTTGDFYQKSTGTWTLITNLKGSTGGAGTNGTDGDDGFSFLQGSGVPGAGLGIDGDSYLDNLNGDLYLKGGGSWSLTGNIFVVGATVKQEFSASKVTSQQIVGSTSLPATAVGSATIMTFADETSAGNQDDAGVFSVSNYKVNTDETGTNNKFYALIKYDTLADVTLDGSGLDELDLMLVKLVGGVESLVETKTTLLSNTVGNHDIIVDFTPISTLATETYYIKASISKFAISAPNNPGTYDIIAASKFYNALL